MPIVALSYCQPTYYCEEAVENIKTIYIVFPQAKKPR